MNRTDPSKGLLILQLKPNTRRVVTWLFSHTPLIVSETHLTELLGTPAAVAYITAWGFLQLESTLLEKTKQNSNPLVFVHRSVLVNAPHGLLTKHLFNLQL